MMMMTTGVWLSRMAAVSMIAAGALNSVPAFAAHRCTVTEINQFTALLDANESSSKPCLRELNKKYSAARVKRACSICAADYKNSRRLDAWIAKHKACATDLHVSKLLRAEREWRSAYKNLCD